ncbi:GTPase [Sphingobacterium siyangense]|uniref:GTPase n=1 Tax=Sphingobacterium siyangense TaxID=459529 RepID=UPI003C780EF3
MDENQIRKILSKAKRLNNIVSDNLASKALEITQLAESSDKKKLLERLISSLEQYIAKEKNIVYIGFVGHFSSGKSSTINSILELSNTQNARHTDLNPTDTTITLITDNANSSKIMHMTRESTYVPVRSVFIESNFLDNLVIADTPGSGDPNIVNELIQDFLPVCDYILYFISAANPIDQADIPLLHQKHLKLPFIPLNFIITRSDEFQLSREHNLSEENIDKSKRDNFIGHLISRLKEFANAGELTVDDFIFIDNNHKYNINKLRSKISDWTTNLDQNALWNNHSHKLEFYASNFEELETYFLNVIINKIRITSNFLSTAGENINKFDAVVEVNNEKLKSVWLESDRTLQRDFQLEWQHFDLIINKFIPKSFTDSPEIKSELEKINNFIEHQSNGNIGRFTAELYQQGKSQILRIQQDIDRSLNTKDFLREDIRDILPPRIEMAITDETLDIDFSKLNSPTTAYLDRLNLLVDSEKLALSSRIDKFITILSKSQLVNTVEQLYEFGAEKIGENFDKYFDVIEMYKASVLTKNTKDTIQKLRIGKQLDDLDDEFSEQYKLTKKQEAISAIYPRKEDRITDFKIAIHAIEDYLNEQKRDLTAIHIRKNNIKDFFGKESYKITEIINEVKVAIENEVNKLYYDKLLRVFEKHRTEFLSLNELKKTQKKVRLNAILKWIVGSAAILLIIYLMLLKMDYVAPTTLVWNVLIGLITTMFGSVLGWCIGFLKNDLKKMTEKHESIFLENSYKQLNAEFNEDFFNSLNLSVSESKPKKLSSLENIYSEKLTSITVPAFSEADETLSKVNAHNELLIGEANKYLELVESFKNSFNYVFTNLDDNILKIGTITQEIKEKSIEPSFALLKNTEADLDLVKKEIEQIKAHSHVGV